MKYLLTGGAGFIGSNLTRQLLQDNNSVICLDNFRTGSKDNISDFIENSNFSFYDGDVRDKNLVDDLVSECDIIFHLAAAVGVKFVLNHPIETILTNVMGTETILEKSQKYNKKISALSTGHRTRFFSAKITHIWKLILLIDVAITVCV